MIVAMQESATEEQIQQVVEHLIEMGFSVHRSTGARQTVVAAVGARVDFDIRNLEVLSGVEHVHRRDPVHQWIEDRRRTGGCDRWPVLGGVARSAFCYGRECGKGRRSRASWRRI
jgi:hypothetical protein